MVLVPAVSGFVSGLISGLGSFAPLILIAVFIIIGALLIISMISPELFRVLIPPELVERAALLPRDAARIINGIAHLYLDVMRAIALL